MPAIEVDRLTVRYGDVVAVRDLSFTADAGQVTCILGRNGAGKTSTIEALEGIGHPAGGRLRVLGLDPQRPRDRRKLSRRIGVMLQDVGIHPAARTGELVQHAAALYRRSLDPVALLDRVGLTGLEQRTFRQLSGGEQRRLALALALVGRPEVAFLDEPTAGVDPAGRQVIREIVGQLRVQGVTVLLSTHDLGEAERLADRVVVIHEGELRAAGTVGELAVEADDRTQPTLRFGATPPLDRAALRAHLSGPHHRVEVEEEAPGRYTVAAEPTPWLIATLTVWLAEQDIILTDLDTGRGNLEDAFLRLTAAPRRPDGEPDEPGSGEPDESREPGEPGEPGRRDRPAGRDEPETGPSGTRARHEPRTRPPDTTRTATSGDAHPGGAAGPGTAASRAADNADFWRRSRPARRQEPAPPSRSPVDRDPGSPPGMGSAGADPGTARGSGSSRGRVSLGSALRRGRGGADRGSRGASPDPGGPSATGRETRAAGRPTGSGATPSGGTRPGRRSPPHGDPGTSTAGDSRSGTGPEATGPAGATEAADPAGAGPGDRTGGDAASGSDTAARGRGGRRGGTGKGSGSGSDTGGAARQGTGSGRRSGRRRSRP